MRRGADRQAHSVAAALHSSQTPPSRAVHTLAAGHRGGAGSTTTASNQGWSPLPRVGNHARLAVLSRCTPNTILRCFGPRNIRDWGRQLKPTPIFDASRSPRFHNVGGTTDNCRWDGCVHRPASCGETQHTARHTPPPLQSSLPSPKEVNQPNCARGTPAAHPLHPSLHSFSFLTTPLSPSR